jgi:hypothetical protein
MMTTITYEERLQAFAKGKRLGQLAKVVRDVEDGVCDACGSALPRTLFGLKDTEADRYYFVGQNCLSELKASGLVARARYRQSAEVAYRKEMENRRSGAGEFFDQGSAATGAEAVGPRPRPSLQALRRTFFVAETESQYEAMVRLEDGPRRVSGHAQEPRWSQGWARQDGGVVLLEMVPRARPNAVTLCLLRAYREARHAWRTRAESDSDRPMNRMRQGVQT